MRTRLLSDDDYDDDDEVCLFYVCTLNYVYTPTRFGHTEDPRGTLFRYAVFPTSTLSSTYRHSREMKLQKQYKLCA